MPTQRAPSQNVVYLDQFVTQKKQVSLKNELQHLPDALPVDTENKVIPW